MLTGVDIVLPCYNPHDSWHTELRGFYEYIKDSYRVNFILVNDGSMESKIIKQVEILKQQHIPLEYISYDVNRGKGFALRHGVLTSESDYVVYTDIDFPFTNDSMYEVIKELTKNNHDIVAGYRDDLYYTRKMSFFRKTLSKWFRYFIGRFLRMPLVDTQCGLKGFNDKGRKHFLNTTINRYLFDFEFIYTALKDRNISLGSVKVQLKDNVVFSKMRLKILIQESFNLMYILFTYRSKTKT
jgi:glycosyltransferase involved in cell wall biosynthesis